MRTWTIIEVIILGKLITSRWVEQSQVGITVAASRGESRHHHGITRTSSDRTDRIVDGGSIGISDGEVA